MIVVERPAAGAADGALVLVHGRGANERDLVGLFDELDPGRRLHGYSPRAPFSLPPGGFQWYRVHRVGFPDPETFPAGFAALAALVDSLPHERVVLAGFSQGAVMSLAVGLGAGRPRPAAVVAFSGFVPVVAGWELDTTAPLPPVAVAHGVHDPVIPVELGRRAAEELEAAGADVLYRESPMGHAIDPAFVAELRPWIAEAVRARSGG